MFSKRGQKLRRKTWQIVLEWKNRFSCYQEVKKDDKLLNITCRFQSHQVLVWITTLQHLSFKYYN